VIANLRYDFSADHSVRVAYTLDYGRHRQTGEVGTLNLNGSATYLFPRDNPLKDVNGSIMQKRDRLSRAILNQASAEYSGRFFDKLTVTLGVRAPFFRRELNQNCYTTSVTGFVDCFGNLPNAAAGRSIYRRTSLFGECRRRAGDQRLWPARQAHLQLQQGAAGSRLRLQADAGRRAARQLLEGPAGSEHGQSVQRLPVSAG
jgi:hypothetical protein